ncbi:MAG TPA: hypothetical protein VF297_13880 [Pyrinomonadaceae bacterium]
MSRRVNTKRKGRSRGLPWGFAGVAFVAALLYWEQAALLYVLSTLAVCGLLLVVAFSDLEGRGKESVESAGNENAGPAVESDVTTVTPPRRERRTTQRTRRQNAA